MGTGQNYDSVIFGGIHIREAATWGPGFWLIAIWITLQIPPVDET